MKNTFKIQKLIGHYKSYVQYKEIIQEERPEVVGYYKFIEMDALREIAELKAENPASFRFACALDKLILN